MTRPCTNPNRWCENLANAVDLLQDIKEQLTKLAGVNVVQRLTGNGTTTVFAATADVNDLQAFQVYVEGVPQFPGNDYTRIGRNVTFVAPPLGVIIFSFYKTS